MFEREFDFDEQFRLGKLGEQHVINFERTKENPFEVDDLTKDSSYQNSGIDIRLRRLFPTVVDIYADIKTEFKWFFSGNIFLETHSGNKPGCFMSSESDYFIFFCAYTGRMVRLPLIPLRKKYYDTKDPKHNWKDYKPVEHIKNKGWYSSGFYISIEEIKNVVPDVQEVIIGGLPECSH